MSDIRPIFTSICPHLKKLEREKTIVIFTSLKFNQAIIIIDSTF